MFFPPCRKSFVAKVLPHSPVSARTLRRLSLVVPRATPELFCQATPELLCREILLVYRADTCAHVMLYDFTIYRSISVRRLQRSLTIASQNTLISARFCCVPKQLCSASRKQEASNYKRYNLGCTLECRAIAVCGKTVRDRLRTQRSQKHHQLKIFG